MCAIDKSVTDGGGGGGGTLTANCSMSSSMLLDLQLPTASQSVSLCLPLPLSFLLCPVVVTRQANFREKTLTDSMVVVVLLVNSNCCPRK